MKNQCLGNHEKSLWQKMETNAILPPNRGGMGMVFILREEGYKNITMGHTKRYGPLENMYQFRAI